jgi:hypothetical protein
MKRFFGNILKIIGGLVAAFVTLCVVFAIIGANSHPSTPTASAQSSASTQHRQASQPAHIAATHDYCNEALTHENESSKQLHLSSRAAYNAAVAGLADNENCADDKWHLVNEGYLLSMKGLSEHFLKDGDSQTDLNQANALLVQCQTTPGLYGTHTGAACETQEMNNIKATTNWDMEAYSR